MSDKPETETYRCLYKGLPCTCDVGTTALPSGHHVDCNWKIMWDQETHGVPHEDSKLRDRLGFVRTFTF